MLVSCFKCLYDQSIRHAQMNHCVSINITTGRHLYYVILHIMPVSKYKDNMHVDIYIIKNEKVMLQFVFLLLCLGMVLSMYRLQHARVLCFVIMVIIAKYVTRYAYFATVFLLQQ